MNNEQNRLTKAIYNTVWVLSIGAFLFVLTSAKGLFEVSKVQKVRLVIDELDDGFFLISDSLLYQTIEKKFGKEIKEKNIGELDENKIEQFLKEDSFIRNAEVYTSPRGILKIRVEQRQPLVRVFSNISGSYYIDRDGYKMPLSHLHTVRSIVISGYIPLWKNGEHVSTNHILQKLYQLSRALHDDEFLSVYIDEIHVNNDGSMVLIPKIGDFDITLDDCENLTSKLSNLKVFLHEVIAKDNWNSFSRININYSNQVIATKRKL